MHTHVHIHPQTRAKVSKLPVDMGEQEVAAFCKQHMDAFLAASAAVTIANGAGNTQCGGVWGWVGERVSSDWVCSVHGCKRGMVALVGYVLAHNAHARTQRSRYTRRYPQAQGRQGQG